jgi:galactonate dehydratase
VRGGYRALKTNILVFGGAIPWNYRAGNGRGPGSPEANFSNHLADAIKDLLSAFEQGVAGKAELMLDLNFNFKPEGLKRIAKPPRRAGTSFHKTINHYDNCVAGKRVRSQDHAAVFRATGSRHRYR